MSMQFDEGVEYTGVLIESYIQSCLRLGRTTWVSGGFPVAGPSERVEEAYQQVKLRLEGRHPWLQLSLAEGGEIRCSGLTP